MMRLLHWALWLYGEACYRCGRDAGYYWALRATCNWCGIDWYGRPTRTRFDEVGRIRF